MFPPDIKKMAVDLFNEAYNEKRMEYFLDSKCAEFMTKVNLMAVNNATASIHRDKVNIAKSTTSKDWFYMKRTKHAVYE